MSDEILGFLQLCADRRYHRKTMEAFERATNLRPDQYWIEATAGGAAAFDALTATASFAYEQGARVMGWASHGDRCGGFPGVGNDEMRAKGRAAAESRVADFPQARHWALFGEGVEAEAVELGCGAGLTAIVLRGG